MKPWLKASLIKFWFYGAVYFFVGWGLFLASGDQLDLIVVLGLREWRRERVAHDGPS
jgi:hypothetical protein